jgi:hypothetical protein
MRNERFGRRAALATFIGVAVGLAGPALTACMAGGNQQAPATKPAGPPAALGTATRAPQGAVVLIDGSGDHFKANWYQRYTTNDAGWSVGRDGAAPPRPKGYDITSKQQFGDCIVHAEFKEPVDASGKLIGQGNSGIGLMGRYEVQILGDYGETPEAHGCGSLYSQKAPLVNASKPATEWQTYDIFFRAPRFDDAGKVTEPARVTVFLNGSLVQNNEAFNGPTGIQYGEYKDEAKSGPLVLQGDHDPVSFRNVWVVPL